MKKTECAALVDISKVRVDPSLYGEERVRDYLRKVGDPHHFRVGDVEVRCSYAGRGPSLEEQLREFIRQV